MILLCFSLWVFFFVSSNAAADSMICREVLFVTQNDPYIVSATIKTFNEVNNTNYITLSDVYFFGNNSDGGKICGNSGCCDDFTIPCNFTSNDAVFGLSLRFENSMYSLWQGYIDDGNIAVDGELLTVDNACMYSHSFISTCCKSFTPAPMVVAKSPRCKNFSNNLSIINSDNNNSTFATLNATFTLTEDKLTVTGIYSGPDNSSIYLTVNTGIIAAGSSNPEFNGSAKDLKNNDYKIILSTDIQVSYLLLPSTFSVDLGRILFRNDQTLLKEGVPFSLQNNCLNITQKFSVTNLTDSTLIHMISYSEFCCQEFESEIITSSSTTKTIGTLSTMSSTTNTPLSPNNNVGTTADTTTQTSNSFRNSFNYFFVSLFSLFSFVKILHSKSDFLKQYISHNIPDTVDIYFLQ